MAAGKRDIEITQGDDYSHVVTMTNSSGAINITGRTYMAQLRKVKTQVLPDASLVVVVTNGVAGELTMTLGHVATAALPTGCYKWSLQEDIGGTLTTILKGEATVVADPTR